MGKTWLRRSVQAGVCRVLVTCEVCGTIHQGYWRLSGHSQNQKIHKQTCWKPTNKVQRPEIKNLFQINLLKPRPLCFVTHKSSPSCSFQVVGDGEISASARWRWLDGNKIPPTILVVKTPTNPIPIMASKKQKREKATRNSPSPSSLLSWIGPRWVRMLGSWGFWFGNWVGELLCLWCETHQDSTHTSLHW